MKQSEVIQQMSDKQLKRSLLFSQLLLFMFALGLSSFLFTDFSEWLGYFHWDVQQILYYGVLAGVVIIIIDIVIFYSLPQRLVDDGGINERIFTSLSVFEIVTLCLMVAISEELLFRGVLQTTFGFIFASIIFALIHIRYLKKPVLLVLIIFVSFYIGYLFELTGNLIVTITAHFIVDCVLGVLIRLKSEVLR